MPRSPAARRAPWVLPTQPGASAQAQARAGSGFEPSRNPIPAESGKPTGGDTTACGIQRRYATALALRRASAGGHRSQRERRFGAGGPGNASSTCGSSSLPNTCPTGTVAILVGLGQHSRPTAAWPLVILTGDPRENRRVRRGISALGGGAAMIAPVGGGNGGIFAQAWRYQQSPPDRAPYSIGTHSPAAPRPAPFNTLNSLILSYIDSNHLEHRSPAIQAVPT